MLKCRGMGCEGDEMCISVMDGRKVAGTLFSWRSATGGQWLYVATGIAMQASSQ